MKTYRNVIYNQLQQKFSFFYPYHLNIRHQAVWLFERKIYADDICTPGKHDVQVWQQALLGHGALCKYGWIKYFNHFKRGRQSVHKGKNTPLRDGLWFSNNIPHPNIQVQIAAMARIIGFRQ